MIETNSALKFPKDFLENLEKLNAKKNDDAPTALVLCGMCDFNGFLTTAATHSQILQIAETHKVSIRAIDDANQFGQKIKSARSLLGRNISLLTIVAHGETDRIYLGKSSIFNFFSKKKPIYQETDIHPEDFSSLAPDAKIALYACKTGGKLAQKIADLTRKTVFAPIGKIYDASTCFLLSRKHGIKMLSYNENGEQHIRTFRPNLPFDFIKPQAIDSKKTCASFSIMAAYLKKRASNGDADAQCKLGIFYEEGRGGLEKSDIEAEKWFRLAAIQGSSLAQLKLGCFLISGRGGLEQSDIKAEKWLKLSAYHGVALAQYYLGIFYFNGRGGLAQSDIKAAFFFSLATHQLLPEGVYNLAVLYEYGRGVPQSNEKAMRLYKIAYDLGIQEAAQRLHRFQEALVQQNLSQSQKRQSLRKCLKI